MSKQKTLVLTGVILLAGFLLTRESKAAETTALPEQQPQPSSGGGLFSSLLGSFFAADNDGENEVSNSEVNKEPMQESPPTASDEPEPKPTGISNPAGLRLATSGGKDIRGGGGGRLFRFKSAGPRFNIA